jgi:hypothetical protein
LPYLPSTLKNAFVNIANNITGYINPNDYDITNRCSECGYEFSKDESLTITRHVDAPDDAVYERHASDRDYDETEQYLKLGSEYDNFFEKIIWFFKHMIYRIKMILKDLTA